MFLNKEKLFLLLGAFLASTSFFVFANAFETFVADYIFVNELKKNNGENIFLANIAYSYQETEEEHFEELNCSFSAESGIVLRVGPGEQEKIIFEKQSEKIMPIASLTKLMTGLVALDFYPTNFLFKISKEAVNQAEITGNLTVGEKFYLSEMLKMSLIESSNDAAFALSEPIKSNVFIDLMNWTAKEIGLKNTVFSNPTGLDETEQDRTDNYSTAFELSQIAKQIILTKPELSQITREKNSAVYLSNNHFHHNAKNTNLFLDGFPQIILGKTGTTKNAGQCLLLALKGEKIGSFYIFVILNSKDRFVDMANLINCAYNK